MECMSIDQTANDIKKKLKEQDKIKVKVALFGQPGAGKSSLINKIVGKKVADVGVETDKTVVACSYEHNGLELVDLPGYGTKGFPKDDFFSRFDIEKFDLFLCVSSGKLHQADTEFFQKLLEIQKVCLFVVNKHDELWEDGVTLSALEKRKRADICKHAQQDVEVFFTSCRNDTGLGALNEAIRNNLDGAKKERWARSAKAYSQTFLDEKRRASEKYVAYAAAAAATNALNPIPGVDVAVDLSVLMKLFSEIRNDFGLDNDFLDSLKHSSIPAVGRMATNVMQFAAKEGIIVLLKRFAGRQAVKTLTKYVPFIGQAIAAGIGYAMTSQAGKAYLDDCYELASARLKNRLDA